jgi:hypothetical protein
MFMGGVLLASTSAAGGVSVGNQSTDLPDGDGALAFYTLDESSYLVNTLLTLGRTLLWASFYFRQIFNL